MPAEVEMLFAIGCRMRGNDRWRRFRLSPECQTKLCIVIPTEVGISLSSKAFSTNRGERSSRRSLLAAAGEDVSYRHVLRVADDLETGGGEHLLRIASMPGVDKRFVHHARE